MLNVVANHLARIVMFSELLGDQSCPVDRDDEGNIVYETKYRGIFGFLLYLISSGSDIIFSVCKYSCFQLAPK